MADEDRPFVINVRRRWTLLILPILALLYFVAIVILYVQDYRINGVDMDTLVLAGVGVFVLVMIIELPFLMRRKAPKVKRSEKQKLDILEDRGEAPAMRDDEYLTTSESQQGMQVVEYSAPAKSRNVNVVYTKTYVPVTGAHVLRVETAVADAADI